MNTAFAVYKYEEEDLVLYLMRCNRVNNNDAFDYRSFDELWEDVNLNVQDLYNGEPMTVSFDVPPTEHDCVQLDSEDQKLFLERFEAAKAEQKKFWDENVEYEKNRKSM